jgi:hypothetical protein
MAGKARLELAQPFLRALSVFETDAVAAVPLPQLVVLSRIELESQVSETCALSV